MGDQQDDNTDQKPEQEKTESGTENKTPEKSGASGSLALAKKYKLGPFKKKPRYKGPSDDTSALQDDAPTTQFSVVANQSTVEQPQKPVWNYDGTLPDKRVRVLSFHSMDLAVIDASMRCSSRDYGFTFNRNGMNYEIKFHAPHGDIDFAEPVDDKFVISQYEEICKIMVCGRTMSHAEASYALDIIEQELLPEKKREMAPILEHLRKNMPTHTSPGKAQTWEEYLEGAQRQQVAYNKGPTAP